MLVLDDAVLGRAHSRAAAAFRRGRAERDAAHPRRRAGDIDDGVARPREVVPHDRRHAVAEKALLERRGERAAVDADPVEARLHVDVVHRVDGTAADRIVRMVLQQRAPQRADVVDVLTTGEGIERLAPLEEQPLADDVLLLDPHTGRVHGPQDRTVPAVDDLARMRHPRRRHHRDVVLETCDPGMQVGRDEAHCREGLG